MGAPQSPVALQLCTPLPAHWTVPETQVPEQTPETQVWFEHGVGVPHCAFAPQVWTSLPEQLTAPGLHMPAQAPAWQMPVHGTPWPHDPVASQVCTLLVPSMHCV
jgi:hypothetical protein